VAVNAAEFASNGDVRSARGLNASMSQNDDVMSVGSLSVNGSVLKAKRVFEIKKLEQELEKLNRRFEQATDPQYIMSLKKRVKEAEESLKHKREEIARLETEQQKLDKQILIQKKSSFLHNDSGTDKHMQELQDVQANTEIQTAKIQGQISQLEELRGEHQVLQENEATEKSKNEKLVAIATEKYSLDLSQLEAYLPKSKAQKHKLKELNKHLLQETMKRNRDARVAQRQREHEIQQAREAVKVAEDNQRASKAKLKRMAIQA
jgi:chromosome segregation ATPase